MSGGGSLEWIGAVGCAVVGTANNSALTAAATDIYNNAGTMQINSYTAATIALKYYAGCITYLTAA